MKKQYFGILISLSLISQPIMAAQLVSLNWKDAEVDDKKWEDKVIIPGKEGRKKLSELSNLVIKGKKKQVQELLKKAQDAIEKAADSEKDQKKLDLYRLLYDLDGSNKPRDTFAMTPLHWAAAKDEVEIADMLIKATLSLIDIKQPGTAAEEAGTSDEESYKNRVPYVDMQDTFGRTPLMFATRKGQKNVAYLLIARGANLDLQDKLGRTALHWASARAELPITEALIDPTKALARLVTWNAIHKNVITEIPDASKSNLSPATVRVQDNMGNTPLHYAASVRYLLNAEKPIDAMLTALGVLSSAGLTYGLSMLSSAAVVSTASIVPTSSATFVGMTAGAQMPVGAQAVAAHQAWMANYSSVLRQLTAGGGYSGTGGTASSVAAASGGASGGAGGGAGGGQAAAAPAATMSASVAIAIIIVVVATTMFIQYGIPAIQKQDKKDKRDKIHADRGNIIAALLARDEATYDGIRSKLKGDTTKLSKVDTGIPALATRNIVGQLPSHVAAMAGNADPLSRLKAQATDDGLDNYDLAKEFGYILETKVSSLNLIVDVAGNTPLMYAVVRGDRSALYPAGIGTHADGVHEGLVGEKEKAAGMKINIGPRGTQGDGEEGWYFSNPMHLTPLKLSLLFAMEVTKGSGKTVEDVLKEVGDQDVYTDTSGQNVLHYAARGGNKVKEIYELYNGKEWYQFVPKIGDEEAHYERRSGISDERMITARDSAGATPIHYVVTGGYVEYARGFLGSPTIRRAVELEFLLSQLGDVDLGDLLDNNGMTPLHYAALAGKAQAVDSLLKYERDREEKGKKLKKRRREAKAEFALLRTHSIDDQGYAIDDQGVRLKNRENKEYKIDPAIANKTARDLAKQAGYLPIYDELARIEEARKAGSIHSRTKKFFGTKKKNKKDEEEKQERKEAKEAQQEREKDEKIAERARRTEKKIERRRLQEAQAKRRDDRRDPLILAAEEGREQSVKLLVRKGHDALAAGEALEAGEDILVRNKDDKTALRIAVEKKGRRKMAVELLEAAQKLDELALQQERTLSRGSSGLSLAEIPGKLQEESEALKKEFLNEKGWSEDDIAEDEDKAAELEAFITDELKTYNDSIIVRSAVDELLNAPYDDQSKSALSYADIDPYWTGLGDKKIGKISEFDAWIACIIEQQDTYKEALESGDINEKTSALKKMLDMCKTTAFDKKAQKSEKKAENKAKKAEKKAAKQTKKTQKKTGKKQKKTAKKASKKK